MSQNVIQPAFTAGEVSPTLWGRVDLAKYKVGLRKCRNFFVDYRGGVSNRAGTAFVGQTRYNLPTRLIPFKFAANETCVLEFGDHYMRVMTEGQYFTETPRIITGLTQANPAVITSAGHGFAVGDWVYFDVTGMVEVDDQTYIVSSVTTDTFTVTTTRGVPLNTTLDTAFISGTVARLYTLATPWAAADLRSLKYMQSADTVTILHPNYEPRDLVRHSATNWTITPINFYAKISPPTGIAGTPSASGSAWFSYTVTAIAESGEESVAGTYAVFQGVNISVTAGSNTIRWNAVDGAQYYSVYRALISSTAAIPVGTTHGYVGMTYGLEFLDTNITPDYTKTPPVHHNPFAVSPITAVSVTAGGSGYVPATTTVTITDPTGIGAIVEPVVVAGAVGGFIILDGGHGYTAPVVTIGGVGAGATAVATVGPATGTYPSCGCYFQQRKMFAASTNFPQTLWGTQPGAFTNMDKSIPITDGDALELTLSSTQINDIQFMLPMQGGLVILTGGGAWQATGSGQQNSVLTPSNATAVPQAFNGCHNDIAPIPINYEILYVQNKGSIVRDLSYNFFSNIYTGIDISALSNHLFEGYDMIDWGFAEEPFKTVWLIRSDGALLCLTFVKEQEVYGWSQHDTQGLFKSIAVVQEGNEDVAYFVVQRYVDGEYVQYVERMASRALGTRVANELKAENGWFLDCALRTALNQPAATLTMTFAGSVTADAAVFTSGDVGKILRAGGGKGEVLTYVSPTAVTVRWLVPPVLVLPGTTLIIPVAAGDWSLQPVITHVFGLDHLEGSTVKVLGDGNVFDDQVVTDGRITLENPASIVLVGLGYTAQMQTLYLDVNIGEGSIQGKRKRVAAVTSRVDNTRGLAIGFTFDDLIDQKVASPTTWGQTMPLYTGDQRTIIPPSYNLEGSICIQQNYPLPITVLAVVPEILIGDSG